VQTLPKVRCLQHTGLIKKSGNIYIINIINI
jgi:hypothetical protein